MSQLQQSSRLPSQTLLTVIVNYRTAALTLKAAEHALREMQEIEGALVIIDNDSQDGSFEDLHAAAKTRGWLQEKRVRVIQSGRNGGFGAGNNIGIRAGLPDGNTPDYVYILNPDAFPGPGSIRALLEHMERESTIGLAGSFIHGSDGTPHTTLFRFPGVMSEFEGAARFGPISRLLHKYIVAMPIPQESRKVDWVAGASLMIRRSVLDQIGLFDERFFLYFEETDLCHRARKAGWSTMYIRESEVAHIGSASTGMQSWTRTPTYWFDSRHYYFTKTHGQVYAACATLAHIAGALIWRARKLVSPSARKRKDPRFFLRDLIRHAVLGAPRS